MCIYLLLVISIEEQIKPLIMNIICACYYYEFPSLYAAFEHECDANILG